MPGRLPNVALKGSQYEKMFDLTISHLATVTIVRREDDFGIDAYGHAIFPDGSKSHRPGDLFTMQVRGGEAGLDYGGVDDHGKWRSHETDWLRTLSVPLFLARVDAKMSKLQLFTMWPVWWVLAQSPGPFEIVCSTMDASETPLTVPDPVPESVPNAPGDATRWAVSLGPPFLELRHERLVANGSALVAAREVLAHRVREDMKTVMLARLGVPVLQVTATWATNTLSGSGMKTYTAWSNDDERVGQLAYVIEPLLMNLGLTLQHRQDPAAYSLIPCLEWLAARNVLSGIGLGLLDGLNKTRAAAALPPSP